MSENTTASHARTAALAIMRDRWTNAGVMVANFTPGREWPFECDVFEITRSGYAAEYEVKVSRGDFVRDADKGVKRVVLTGGQPDCQHVMGWENGRYQCRCGAVPELTKDFKHERLAAGDVRGPSRFWFVSPMGVLSETVIPPWAGWIELMSRGPGYEPRYRVIVRTPAPRLHTVKAPAAVERAAFRACHFRYHRLLAGGA